MLAQQDALGCTRAPNVRTERSLFDSRERHLGPLFDGRPFSTSVRLSAIALNRRAAPADPPHPASEGGTDQTGADRVGRAGEVGLVVVFPPLEFPGRIAPDVEVVLV